MLRFIGKILIGTVGLAFAVMLLSLAWLIWDSGLYYCADADGQPISSATTDDGRRIGPRQTDVAGEPCGTYARHGVAVQNTDIAVNTVRFGGALVVVIAVVGMCVFLVAALYQWGTARCAYCKGTFPEDALNYSSGDPACAPCLLRYGAA